MPMIAYACPDCGFEDEHFHHHASDAPQSVECRGYKFTEAKTERVERRVEQPDGTIVIEYEEVILEPEMKVCGGTAPQRESWFDASWSRPARGFEQLSVFEVVDYEHKPDDYKRTHQRFYVPGRNYEPTEPGMIRHDITNMAEYNRFVRTVNAHETQKMSDHREMHREYWGARRRAMRDDVNARIRHEPLLLSLARLMRKRSDQKSNVRYGKPLNANFHAQLIEFNQGNMQDYCDADTGWKSRRAK